MDDRSNIQRTLGEILGELKGMNRQFDVITSQLNDHASAIDELKTFKDQYTGKASIVGGIAGAVLGIVGAWISQKLGI